MVRAISEDAAAAFSPLRPMLLRIAYRMLGSVADAEDIVQEAFLRWMDVDRSAVRAPEALLRRTVMHLCLDQLKLARHRRETYMGPWLPDPVIEDDNEEDVTLPLMLALERLSPLERAAFLLHDVFGVAFDEVAQTIKRDPTTCRQLAAPARTHVRQARPRFEIEKQQGLAIVEAFFAASRGGDTKTLRAMLTADVSLHADGGGRRPAAPQPILGFDTVITLLALLASRYESTESQLVRSAFVNGLPGFITRESDGEFSTTALELEQGKITAIYVVRNPEKLKHLHSALKRSI
jgi:RNA polymerase sigma-70 factor (ECF subfamily)